MAGKNVCIIPAAGRGSRWAPISGYLPKEMLPLVDKPVIEWVINEAWSSGFEEIVVVINKQKTLIREYLLKNKALNKKVKMHFVNQDLPLGITDVMLKAKSLIGDRYFGMALPDLPTISKKPVLRQLLKVFQSLNGEASIVSFNAFPTEYNHFYTECLVEPLENRMFEISHYCPKNKHLSNIHHPQNKMLQMSGRYIFAPSIFPILQQVMNKHKNQDVNEVVALEAAQKKGQKVIGFAIQGHTYDTGNPESYIRANTAFFKKRLAKSS